nr:immunoglobulin light chain junction region [Macaca mulatta]MOW30961.1 immunoglobulin light chain junction region [Macaca mulatta]MOW31221.1 immunoglobulin light chain junction region [Macaca mulatta]MOW31236.1 immunoglobulin light chain junction region [Macaca mulatta]MOW31406.1 immunoglobulin light chain junction region [Macaca mulatta]
DYYCGSWDNSGNHYIF